jgi:hypothetical protein
MYNTHKKNLKGGEKEDWLTWSLRSDLVNSLNFLSASCITILESRKLANPGVTGTKTHRHTHTKTAPTKVFYLSRHRTRKEAA